MAESHEVQYQPPDGPPPSVVRKSLENPFSDDTTLDGADTASDLTQITAPDSIEFPGSGPNDRFIAVMGVTGAGKSTFIGRCTGMAPKVGHDLVSCTVDAAIFSFKHGDLNVHLVDTPGFDDTRISDEDVLKNIAFWLMESYEANVRLSGIVYLHPIHKNRMTGSAHKNLQMFKKLCGDESLASVVLATTMWSKVSEPDGKKREEQLETEKDFWRDMIGQGSVVFRHDDTQDSAIKIIDHILNRGQTIVVGLQRQIMVDGMELENTDAVREYRRGLEVHIQRLDDKLDQTRAAMRAAVAAGDEQRRQTLQLIIERHEREREETDRRHKAKVFRMEEMLERQTEALEAQIKSKAKMSEDFHAKIQALNKKMIESKDEERRRMSNQLALLTAEKLKSDRSAQILAERLRLQQQVRNHYNPAGAAVAAQGAHALGQVAAAGIVATVVTAAVCNVM